MKLDDILVGFEIVLVRMALLPSKPAPWAQKSLRQRDRQTEAHPAADALRAYSNTNGQTVTLLEVPGPINRNRKHAPGWAAQGWSWRLGGTTLLQRNQSQWIGNGLNDSLRRATSPGTRKQRANLFVILSGLTCRMFLSSRISLPAIVLLQPGGVIWPGDR